MSTALRKCIWYDQCGSECYGKCDFFSPADESKANEAFYQKVLMENAQEYKKTICDYSDKE